VKTEFRRSFAKDASLIKTKSLRHRIEELIELVEQAPSLAAIPNLKKLRYSGDYYRVRVGEYRVGLILEGGVVTFVRCLHRKDIYRYFP
jgi:mRNA interferase RelE/StbE